MIIGGLHIQPYSTRKDITILNHTAINIEYDNSEFTEFITVDSYELLNARHSYAVGIFPIIMEKILLLC